MLQSGRIWLTIFVVGAALLVRGATPRAEAHGSAVGSLVGIQASPVIQTQWGPVRGMRAGQTYTYLGIPFAASPVGDQRWKPPSHPDPWEDERPATTFGPACPQVDDEGNLVGSENCLYLNIWTPIGAEPETGLPVLVFIHGGGNVQGSSSQGLGERHLYDGQLLAESGQVVVVTLQYRLGALGFLVHPDLATESSLGVSGNYGLLDQIAGLEWVQSNIRNFGGDPSRVLIFGESAGAVDVCMLLASPLAAGLFSRALMQSGGCVARTAAERSVEGQEFVEAAGCGDAVDKAACLRNLDVETLVTAVETQPIRGGVVRLTFGPTIDGYVLPQAPMDALTQGQYNRVPFIIGANADEMLPMIPALSQRAFERSVRELLGSFGPAAVQGALALYPVGSGPGQYSTPREAFAALATDAQFVCPARQIARAVAEHDQPVFRYFFTQHLSSPLYSGLGAFHGLELLFVFQHIDLVQGYRATDADVALQSAILGYWTRFAASGNPNGRNAVNWPVYDSEADPYLELGTPLAAGDGVRTVKCDFWDGLQRPQAVWHLPLVVR